VVRLNKPTSTGGDDPKKIHYQKMEYKDNREKTTQSPNNQNLTFTQNEINNKKRKILFLPYAFCSYKREKRNMDYNAFFFSLL
jgi:hypothetical protein